MEQQRLELEKRGSMETEQLLDKVRPPTRATTQASHQALPYTLNTLVSFLGYMSLGCCCDFHIMLGASGA